MTEQRKNAIQWSHVTTESLKANIEYFKQFGNASSRYMVKTMTDALKFRK